MLATRTVSGLAEREHGAAVGSRRERPRALVTTEPERPARRPGEDGVVPAPGREWVYLFDADGAVVGSSGGEGDPLAPPVRDLADLASRFRQVDGVPLELGGRGRRLAVSASGVGRRVLLASEPLAALADVPGFPMLAVAVLPFGPEDDPRTLNALLGSVLAHELRTPLTTVYAGADLLSAEGLSEAARTDAARSVAREAARLDRVVEDLIVLVRASIDPPPETEPVLLRPVLTEAVSRVRRLDRRAVIELNVADDLPPVLASEALVHHLVRNLLEHALARTPRGEAIALEAERVDGRVEIRVVDRGPVADAATVDAAFELFASLPGSADASGANLTMVVARRLAERVGGAIRAETRPDGTGAIVSLPTVPHDAAPSRSM